MANKAEYDSRPNPISKDVQESDNLIPLSPQWLLPKPGDDKIGMTNMDNHSGSISGHSNFSDINKLPGHREDFNDNNKKKDVFRPSILEMESARRDRRREEERDTNSAVLRDRWKDGDREHVESRRVDRRADPSEKQHGEAYRPPGERWTDTGKRENHDQRRENKWSTRWGPDDKETYAVRERGDPNKEIDSFVEKGFSHTPHGKDEKGSDHYRPWRPNISYGRGRVDSHLQSPMPNKPAHVFSHGRGRSEIPTPSISPGWGSGKLEENSVISMVFNSQSSGSVIGKGESVVGDFSPLKYSRSKLIDIYRTTDLGSCAKCFEGIISVQSLTEEEPMEPMAFSSPTPEELVILNGIVKGEIVNSGAPQISKDGSGSRTNIEFMPHRQDRPGSRDDLLDGSKIESLDDAKGVHPNYYGSLSHEKHLYSRNTDVQAMRDYQAFSEHKLYTEGTEDKAILGKNTSVSRESGTPKQLSSSHSGSWRSSSFAERSHSTTHGWKESPTDVQKDINVRENNLMDASHVTRGSKRDTGDDPIVRSQPSPAFDREMEQLKASHRSPEDLLLYYKDPQGEIQGPFSGSDIITWFEGGFFGIDLEVRLSGVPAGVPFSSLGDVMPHLRAKSRPPPGFSTPKTNEPQDLAGRLNYSSFGRPNLVSNDPNLLKSDKTYALGSKKDSENRFLESLMSGNMSSSPIDKFAHAEGMQGYSVNNSSSLSHFGSDNCADDSYVLSKKLLLDRQRSVPNPYSLSPGRDPLAFAAKADAIDPSLAHPSISSSLADNARVPHSQSADLMSSIHGLYDRSALNVNNVGSWFNFPVQGGLDSVQDNFGMHHGQNILPPSAFGVQQQKLQPHNSSLSNLLSQSMDNPPNMLTLETILNSGLPQDPQLLNLLQQQYLIQLQSQSPVLPQLSDLDKLLLLKCQQKHEEQIRQHKQLLSQLMSEHQPHQQLGEPSLLNVPNSSYTGANTGIDLAQFQHLHEFSHTGSQKLVTLPDETASDVNLLPIVSLRLTSNAGSDMSSVHPPHQIFGTNLTERNWDAFLLEKDDSEQAKSSFISVPMETKPKPETENKSLLQQSLHYEESVTIPDATCVFRKQSNDAVSLLMADQKTEILIPQQTNLLTDTQAKTSEEPQNVKDPCIPNSHTVKAVKNVEVRETKKSSDKKSKKQKSLKVSTDSEKGVSKMQPNSLEFEGSCSMNEKFNALTVLGTAPETSVSEKEKHKLNNVATAVDNLPWKNTSLSGYSVDDGMKIESKGTPDEVPVVSPVKKPTQALRIWKSAPGFKPKSFLEIQQEEQRRAQDEIAASEISISFSSMKVETPWAEVVVNSDHKAVDESQPDSTELISKQSENASITRSEKGHADDLFWESNVIKAVKKEMEFSDPVTVTTPQMDSGNDFIVAKDTKKCRKKSSKAKGAGAKVTPVASVEVPARSIPIEKGKNYRLIQQEKEFLPAVPSGPSLGDFVIWKGESTSPSPALAWSTESRKSQKPASLRDILREQESKVSSSQPIQVPTPQKPAANTPARAGRSWPLSSSPSAKGSAPIPITPQSSHSKQKIEDDLFWGPSEQPKPEEKRFDFPLLGTQSSRGSKSTQLKVTPGGSLNQQKSIGSKPVEYLLSASASPRPSLKGKKDALTKRSEALDFKEWCENECVRLIGSRDTSFLEFCLKQSREEAETLLIENLGSYDSEHEFIDKFLNYKDFLPEDVFEIALKSRTDKIGTSTRLGETTSNRFNAGESAQGSMTTGDGETKGGKKKGKKGKKVSLSALGFNVVSNRIMMGEIQTVED